MEDILVVLNIRFISGNDEFSLVSNVFKWGYKILPEIGDLINFSHFEMIGTMECDEISYNAINHNYFPFHHKVFTELQNHRCIELCFGDWDD